MGAPERDIFVRNAYRTLGLSGSATQAAVDAAARRMRIWPDPSRIPPTPWDVPSWGAVPRGRSDVERAVARLSDPRSRIEERLRWFIGATPDAREDGAARRHDDAVAALHQAAMADGFDAAQWAAVAQRLRELNASTEWADAHAALEAQGDFEKRASPGEVREAAGEFEGAVVGLIVERATRAAEAGDATALKGIAPLVGGLAPARRWGLADSLEDLIELRRRRGDKALRGALWTNASNPAPYYSRNHAETLKAAGQFDRQVAPLLEALADIAPEDEERLTRARSSAATYLILIALGWEWAGRWDKARDALERAKVLAAGTVVELEAERELARVRPRAAAERAGGKEAVERYKRWLSEPMPAAAAETGQDGDNDVGFDDEEDDAEGSERSGDAENYQTPGERLARQLRTARRAARWLFAVGSIVAVVYLAATGPDRPTPPPLPYAADSQRPPEPLRRSAPAPPLASDPLSGEVVREPAWSAELRRGEEFKATQRPTTLPAEDVGESIREP